MRPQWISVITFIIIYNIISVAFVEATEMKLNKAEQYIFQQVKKGKTANLEKQFSNEKDRTIRASFLKELILNPPNKKGVSINSTVIIGALELKRMKILSPILITSSKFSGDADFSGARFSGDADFSGARFSGDADFSRAKFSGDASFSRAKFSEEASFIGAKFSGDADFYEAEFSGRAYFSGARFSGDADFYKAKFSGDAFFIGARFSGDASFIGAKFSGEALFYKAKFSGDADFREAKFSTAIFSHCAFEKNSYFVGCHFQHKASLEGVTGFSNMMIEWEYDIQWGKEKKIQDIQYQGLRGHLEYDETFYIALIKNYQDMGWFLQADDAYHTYRIEKRKIREKHTTLMERIKGKAEKYFLEIPFGYGVKPSKLFRTFIVLWIFFSICYLFFIRKDKKVTFSLREVWSRFKSYMSKNWWKPWKHIYHFLLVLVNNRFAWVLIHSLDNITPGINFRSMETIGPYLYIKTNSNALIYLQRFQQVAGWYLLLLLLTLFNKICIR